MNKPCAVSLVGIGPWDEKHLTRLAAERLAEDAPIFSAFAPEYHPVIQRLANEGRVTSLFAFYEAEEIPHRQKYEIFTEIVVRAALQHGRAIWLVPGNAFVYDSISGMIVQRCAEEGVDVEVVPGLSSVEAIYAELRVDPGARGMHMLNAYLFDENTVLDTRLPSMLLQVMWPNIAIICATLARHFPEDHEVVVVQCAGYAGGGVQTRVAVGDLEEKLRAMERAGVNDSLVSMYVPAVDPQDAPVSASKVFCRTASQLVEYELMEGGLLLIPLRLLTDADDVADVQVVLDQPEYLKLWELLKQPRTVEQLTEEMGDLVRGPEHVRHMLIRFFDHGLIDKR